jgi:hypothetical protein
MATFTTGFTNSTAERFLRQLDEARVGAAVDTRLCPRSLLEGFAKQPNLGFFLARIGGIDCPTEPLLAPNEDDFRAYCAGEMGCGRRRRLASAARA